MNWFRFINFRNFFIVCLFLLITVGYCYAQTTIVSAQETQPKENQQRDTAPPPLKFITKEEAQQLNAELDIKKRTKLALDLMEIRLKNAEQLNAQGKYTEMFNELGDFQALIDKTLDFLDRNDNGGGKVLNNFKRVEMTLRSYLPRLELIRRDLPARYEFYVRSVEKYVRDARSRAIDPLFGNTVIKNNNN